MQEISGLEADSCKVLTDGLRWLKLENAVKEVIQLNDVKGSNLHDFIEEDSCIRWQSDVEEGHQHDELLSVYHAP